MRAAAAPAVPQGLWAKGFSELLDRMAAHRARCEAEGRAPPELDVYGKGEDLDQVRVHRRGRKGMGWGLPCLSFATRAD